MGTFTIVVLSVVVGGPFLFGLYCLYKTVKRKIDYMKKSGGQFT